VVLVSLLTADHRLVGASRSESSRRGEVCLQLAEAYVEAPPNRSDPISNETTYSISWFRVVSFGRSISITRRQMSDTTSSTINTQERWLIIAYIARRTLSIGSRSFLGTTFKKMK
jgi:hypothetical protein